MDEKPQYNISLTRDEITLIKEVFDYEIEEAHDIMGTDPLEDDEREEWRAYLKSLIAFCRRLDTNTVEKIPVKSLLNEERIEVLHPEFLEID